MMSVNIKKIAVVIIIFVAAQLIIRIVNIKKDMRGRQIAVTFLSPLLAGFLVIRAYLNFETFTIGLLNDFFDGMIIVWNIIIIGSFLGYKLVLCPFAKAIWSNNAIMSVTGTKCYFYDDSVNKWFLKQSYKNMRNMMNVLSWVATAITIAVMSIDWIVGDKSDWYIRIFPAAAMIVITELFNYLSGYTREEYERKFEGEDISFHKKGGYYKLRKVYEGLFPSELLVSHTGNEYLGREGSTLKLETMSKEGDTIEREVGDYFLHLDEQSGFFDTDLIDATTSLMRKKNVVILNPFYRDLTDYLLLPIVSTSFRDEKCLVITGRDNTCEDIMSWLTDMFYKYGKTRKLWRVEKLEKYTAECEVGVLSFSQIYDVDIIRANKEFFENVGFVLLIEASRMITTGQIGLGILADYMHDNEDVTLCALDRNVDGLVDVVSHVFKADITTVVAPALPRSVYTTMAWNANGDYKRQKMFNNETRYLGDGIELASVALRNQVRHVSWFSSEKAPIQDIKWIAGQYYPHITKYANLTNQQHSIEDRLSYNTNLWGSEVVEEGFVIAEDEFCNLFETLRLYLSRGSNQIFVNVISENYLLRDYMRYNWKLFMTDPKAIPSFSTAYAKTERNTVLKLILMMAEGAIEEKTVNAELELLGIETDDIYSKLLEMIAEYTDIDDTIITVRNRQLPGDDLLPERKREYFITKDVFNKYFSSTIKNAYFIVEDEEKASENIDAKLFGHITQLVMPNQMIVHNGKAYKVNRCTPELGCILRRASDTYNGRSYYKQQRKYVLKNNKGVISAHSLYDMEISFEKWDFEVSSTGFIELNENNDLRTARLVDLSNDPSIENYHRKYKNKSLMKMLLPDTDRDDRFTFAVLLGELFRTLYPDIWPYIAVLTEKSDDENGMLNKIGYELEGEFEENAVYIVEDSEIDLGILESIDNNLVRILEILADYLEWHFDKIKEPPMKDPVLDKIVIDEEDLKIKESFASKLAKGISKLFGIVKKKKDNFVDSTSEPVVVKHEDANFEENKEVEPQEQETEVKPGELEDEDKAANEQADHVIIGESELSETFDLYESGDDKEKKVWMSFDRDNPDQSQMAEVDVLIDDSEKIKVNEDDNFIRHSDELPNELEIAMPIPPSRYQQKCFLNLGFEEIDKRVKIERVKTYLSARGLGDNNLTKARRRKRFEDNFLDFNAENICDFCGKPLSGVSYDILADGRVRCNDCSTTAIKDVKEFREIFTHTEMMMENIFEIIYPVAIAVHTADAKKIAKHSHSVYKPSKDYAARSLGFAQYKSGEYTIYIENGCPKLVALNIIAHEMAHIWQYINWNEPKLKAIYKQDKPQRDKIALDLVYEGMAVWASIQILYSMGETYFAEQMEQEYISFDPYDKEKISIRRNDVYGHGYYLYRERFHVETTGEIPALSPFKSFPPLDPEKVQSVTRILLPDDQIPMN